MKSPLRRYTADHRYLLQVVARQAGFAAPIVLELDEFAEPLLKKARRGEVLPFDGVLVRDWDPDHRRIYPGIQFGMRLYEIEGIRFVRVRCTFHDYLNNCAFDFYAADRKDYRRLYKVALRCRRDSEPPSQPPVLPAEQANLLWRNTIDYLDPANLRRIKRYGGRAKRGVLLTGSPGNGKTMACRWIWEECRQRRWDWRLVTPDAYQQARNNCDPVTAVKELFTVERRGIVFFDDMDIALRDRETVKETDDQAVFLGALDGITINEGVVFVFTTNCALELIDRAFKRPGRIDLVLHFKEPEASLRRQLCARWHEEIRSCLDMEEVVASTNGFSFAEIEELKNLLVMHFLESDHWDWSWAWRQFHINRNELASHPRRRAGFGQDRMPVVAQGNGTDGRKENH
jgi:hypothetical protein